MENNRGLPDPVASIGGRRKSFLAALLIAVAVGLIALAFQHLVHQKRQPIFDSVSYLDRMHRVMSITVRDGYQAGLKESVVGNTVCLPYLSVLPLSNLVSPGRWIGVAFQTVGVAMFLVLLDRWMIRAGVSRCRSRVAALASFASMEVVWFTNGGLSDFRMDFSLMLGYGMTAMAAGLALRTGFIRDWVLCGSLAAGTCLVRGTAPIYLASALVPVWLIHFSRGRRNFAGAGLAIAVCAALCGWFYWINFDYLKYYYLVWNTDANASLTWGESSRHFLMVSRQSGVPFLSGSLVLCSLAWKWRIGKPAAGREVSEARGKIAEMLWCAAVPLALLVGKGAGINPFVSMPAMIALFVALSTLLAKWLDRLDSSRATIVMCLIGLTVAGAVGRGVKKHGWPKDQYMMACQQVISDIVADAGRTGLSTARFGSLQTCDLFTDSLWGVVQYDRPDARFIGQFASIGGLRLEPNRLFMLPAQVNWDEVPGSGDPEKRLWLVAQLESEIDYLILPDEITANAIHLSDASDVINRHIPEIRGMILDGPEVEWLGDYSSPTSPNRYQLFRIGLGRNEKPPE